LSGQRERNQIATWLGKFLTRAVVWAHRSRQSPDSQGNGAENRTENDGPAGLLQKSDNKSLQFSELLRTNSHAIEGMEATSEDLKAVKKDASGAGNSREVAFRLESRPDFRWAPLEVAKKEQHDRRRGIGMGAGENKFWAVATPL
jgi:hypothetical protein